METARPQSQFLHWLVKPPVKRSGGLTYVRHGLGVTGRMTNSVACPLFLRGSAGGPPPSPRLAGGGEWFRQAPAPFLLCSSQYGGVEIRLVQCMGVCRVSRRSETCGTLSTCFRPRSFLVARGNPASGGIRERPAYRACAIHSMPLGLSLILAPGALPQSSAVLCVSMCVL
jgi:hypothetical protein